MPRQARLESPPCHDPGIDVAVCVNELNAFKTFKYFKPFKFLTEKDFGCFASKLQTVSAI